MVSRSCIGPEVSASIRSTSTAPMAGRTWVRPVRRCPSLRAGDRDVRGSHTQHMKHSSQIVALRECLLHAC
jgi:hypothetical protein